MTSLKEGVIAGLDKIQKEKLKENNLIIKEEEKLKELRE